MDTVMNIQNVVETQLKRFLRNPYIMAILKIALVLYASQIAPRVSPYVSSIFQLTIVKIVFIALIAYVAEVDFQLAIILAVIFVLSINLLSGRGPLESYEDSAPGSLSKDTFDLLGKPTKPNGFKMLESKTDEFIGCQNVKLNDLLAIFDNDALKLQQTVQFTYQQLMEKMPKGTAKDNLIRIARAAGLPYNVELNDENSAFVASILLQHGYIISETCQAPH